MKIDRKHKRKIDVEKVSGGLSESALTDGEGSKPDNTPKYDKPKLTN